MPTGPVTIFVHIASVWVPFTSESKEAIAHYPEIIKGTGLGIIVPKYALIGALSKIEFDAAVEQSPGIKKLVEVGKKYLELVNIDRPYDTTAPRS